jgi:hypothetical protein
MTKRHLEPSSFKHSGLFRHSCFVIQFIPHSLFFQRHPSVQIFSYKICCDLPEARLVASKFSKIVLGGTAALHAYRVWGAVIFWGEIQMMNDEEMTG